MLPHNASAHDIKEREKTHQSSEAKTSGWHWLTEQTHPEQAAAEFSVWQTVTLPGLPAGLDSKWHRATQWAGHHFEKGKATQILHPVHKAMLVSNEH